MVRNWVENHPCVLEEEGEEGGIKQPRDPGYLPVHSRDESGRSDAGPVASAGDGNPETKRPLLIRHWTKGTPPPEAARPLALLSISGVRPFGLAHR